MTNVAIPSTAASNTTATPRPAAGGEPGVGAQGRRPTIESAYEAAADNDPCGIRCRIRRPRHMGVKTRAFEVRDEKASVVVAAVSLG